MSTEQIQKEAEALCPDETIFNRLRRVGYVEATTKYAAENERLKTLLSDIAYISRGDGVDKARMLFEINKIAKSF